HHPDEVAREVFGGVRRRLDPLALAVAALIERDHVEPLGERGRDQIEPVRVRRATVEEAEGGTTGATPVEEVQPKAVDAERPRARQSWPKMVTGKVLDGDRQPLAGASIVIDAREYRTESDGTFGFEGAPSSTPLVVKMPGFEKVTVEPQRRPVEVVLRPNVVKAAYL